ncbi:hypothetical protein LINPERPRIM_LOCUS15759 [Linum perenne]
MLQFSSLTTISVKILPVFMPQFQAA